MNDTPRTGVWGRPAPHAFAWRPGISLDYIKKGEGLHAQRASHVTRSVLRTTPLDPAKGSREGALRAGPLEPYSWRVIFNTGWYYSEFRYFEKHHLPKFAN